MNWPLDVFNAAVADAKEFRLSDEGVEDKGRKMRELNQRMKEKAKGKPVWWINE